MTTTTDTSVPAGRPGAPSAWIDYDAERIVDPDQDTLRSLARTHTPAVLETAFGNLNKVSRNKARMAQFTYVITEDGGGDHGSHKTIAAAEAERLIALQRDYIEAQGKLIEIRGWLGVGPRAVPVQWLYTVEGANIAGMQQILAFPRSRNEAAGAPFRPRFRIVYTPNFRPPVEGGQRILVDLENRVTYIMGPDYFGESKKAALRMLCDAVYEDGGLVFHAGAKEVLLEGDERLTVAVLGLSGTGKTTTTFSRQGKGVRPVQDDMVVLWPDGELSVTENGCFAKTFGLDERTEPVLHQGSTQPAAWLENAYQDRSGVVDFFKEDLTPDEVAALRDIFLLTGADAHRLDQYISGEVSPEEVLDEHGVPRDGWDFVRWTENGRSIIPLACIPDAADLDDLAPVRSMGILNRDEGGAAITPGIVRFTSPAQAAGYFMLGETSKTSAAGKDRGRTRSPFTQPFFPREHGLQARRFGDLLATTDEVETWLMNTGFVGGDAGDVEAGRAHKVKIRHSSAMLEALFRGEIAWKTDEDFGYQVVDVDDPRNAALLDKVPAEILCPRTLYEAQGRLDVYREEVALRHRERREFLRRYEVDPSIVDAVAK